MDATIDHADALALGHEAFGRRDWSDAHARLTAAHAAVSLAPADRERLAIAAQLVGRDAEWEEHLAAAHQGFLRDGDVEGAARCAFWLGHVLTFRGAQARGGGWLARARRLLDESPLDSVIAGYLLLTPAIARARSGDASAYDDFARAAEIGARFGDAGLVTFARHAQGRVLVGMGRVDEGIALLDEVLVAVTADDLAPTLVGFVYCSALDVCFEICDLRRAQEWTAALTTWCAAQQGLVAYRGHCRVRRAEVLQLYGAWPDALTEARAACASFAGERGPAGAAFYQCGELHRLRGEYAEAEAAYREATALGYGPLPGLALLRLAQGDVDAAAATATRAAAESRTVQQRARTYAACVEIELASGRTAGARAAADALAALDRASGVPYLHALATHAAGAVLLAEGDAAGAARALRDAGESWRELDAPYEVARACELLARAHAALGDDDAARATRDAARRAFAALGAAPDVARLGADDARDAHASHASHAVDGAPVALTAREVEVLRLLATGRTNRAIAGALGISEKTVARHVANIFGKLAVTSRAGATAYAFRHALV